MPSILIIQNYYTPYRADLFLALRRKLDLTVLYYQKPSDEGREWVQPENLDYNSVELRSLRLGKIVAFWPSSTLLKQKWDAIVALDDNPSSFSMLILCLRLSIWRIPILLWVEHINDSYKSRPKLLFQRLMSRSLLSLSKLAICFSGATIEYVDRARAGSAVAKMVQSTPLAPERTSVRGPLVRRFGYLGSGSARKNLGALISAFDNIKRSDALLVVAGTQPPTGHPGVVGLGYVDGEQRERFFDQIDALVLPSLADPWGLVVNEALQRGCLAVCTEHCGSSEMLRQVDERLVCGSSASELRGALTWLISLNAEQVSALKAKAAQVVAQYSSEAAAALFAAAVNKATGARP